MVSNRQRLSEPLISPALLSEVRALSRPLQSSADLDPLIERIKDAHVVLLGEASHGTHEYYTWRTAITKRLIEEGGFSLIAVEGDWPACYEVNRFINSMPKAPRDVDEALSAFRRWPAWMWANEEVRELVDFLTEWNQSHTPRKRIGFFGLDVYSLWESLHQVTRYLKEHQLDALPTARRALQCFEPFGEDAQEYARFTKLVPHSCEDEVIKLLGEMRSIARSRDLKDADDPFVAEQNAIVLRNAEAYYRAMVRSDNSSWNVRDRHMIQTLDRLLGRYGGKAIVWEHNTHVGDARYTDMAAEGMVNVGQLAREAYGDRQVAIVGFGSYRGEVIAGAYWDAPWERMSVPAARPGSWEEVLHDAEPVDKLILLDNAAPEFEAWRGHRAIGVVYHPQRERYGNYVPTLLPKRYDAFIYLDVTTAVRPLFPPAAIEMEEMPETFPSGV